MVATIHSAPLRLPLNGLGGSHLFERLLGSSSRSATAGIEETAGSFTDESGIVFAAGHLDAVAVSAGLPRLGFDMQSDLLAGGQLGERLADDLAGDELALPTRQLGR